MDFAAFLKKPYVRYVAATGIVLLCLLMLVINQGLFRMSPSPMGRQALYETEIDGYLDYIAQRNGQSYFSIRQLPNQFYRVNLTPLANNPGLGFYQNACINDFIHKPGGSDTVVLIKNKARYYFRVE